MKSHSKLEIASKQLESAIGLFVSNRDKLSAITLAGAADTIFSQLLLEQGKETFTDHVRKEKAEKLGEIQTREELGNEINNVLGINALKHFDKDMDEYVELDLDECALAAVAKAVVNYIEIAGRKAGFIKAFLYWANTNVDPKRLQNNDPFGTIAEK